MLPSQPFPFRAPTWTKSASCANQISQIIISFQTTEINHDARRTSRFVEGPKIVQSCSKKVNNSWHSCTHSHFNNIYTYGFSWKMKANAPSDFHLKIQILLSLNVGCRVALLSRSEIAKCGRLFLGCIDCFDNLINAKKFHLESMR